MALEFELINILDNAHQDSKHQEIGELNYDAQYLNNIMTDKIKKQ
jgi:hypothetical protein